jgi:capsular polysaccharide export protein
MRPLDAQVFAQGFSWRKRALVRAFTERADVRFVRRTAQLSQIASGSSLLLWGSAPVPEGLAQGVHVYRLEDGFVRSVGLGADLVRPLSWVLDDVGMYYDATRPSRLEQILQSGQWDEVLLGRARQLRQRVLQAGLTKYNLSGPAWPGKPGRQVVLVVGQVESDASLAWGGLDVRSNLALLRKVRVMRPDAWLVYKPHPDVVAGLRGQGQGEASAASVCDEVLLRGDMHQILQRVDEVHVITSLTGFEALLRAKAVFCHGHPFYAGWGLTHDSQPHPRRTRRLHLDELVAGALLQYPRYVDVRSQQICSAETALDALAHWQAQVLARTGGRTPWYRRLLRPWLARP